MLFFIMPRFKFYNQIIFLKKHIVRSLEENSLKSRKITNFRLSSYKFDRKFTKNNVDYKKTGIYNLG